MHTNSKYNDKGRSGGRGISRRALLRSSAFVGGLALFSGCGTQRTFR